MRLVLRLSGVSLLLLLNRDVAVGDEKSKADVDILRFDLLLLLDEVEEVGLSLWMAKVSDCDRPSGTPSDEGGAESTRDWTRVN